MILINYFSNYHPLKFSGLTKYSALPTECHARHVRFTVSRIFTMLIYKTGDFTVK